MTTAPLRETTAWARNLAAPLRDFLRTETGGAVVLLVAAVVALLWANSPWPDSYEEVWETELSIRLGEHGLSLGLRAVAGTPTFFINGRRHEGAYDVDSLTRAVHAARRRARAVV